MADGEEARDMADGEEADRPDDREENRITIAELEESLRKHLAEFERHRRSGLSHLREQYFVEIQLEIEKDIENARDKISD